MASHPPSQCGASVFDFLQHVASHVLSPLEQNLQITLTKKCYKSPNRWEENLWSCRPIGEIFSQFLPILATPTVQTVLAVRLKFHLLIKHLDLICAAKYLQDIYIIDEDIESKT